MALSPTPQEPEGRDSGGGAEGAEGSAVLKPTSVSAWVPSGTRLAREVRAHAPVAATPTFRGGVASPPWLGLPVGTGALGPARGSPAPKRSPAAACVLGSGAGEGVSRERFRTLGNWGGAEAFKESSPRGGCVPQAPPYLRPRPARGSASLPRLAGCGARP